MISLVLWAHVLIHTMRAVIFFKKKKFLVTVWISLNLSFFSCKTKGIGSGSKITEQGLLVLFSQFPEVCLQKTKSRPRDRIYGLSFIKDREKVGRGHCGFKLTKGLQGTCNSSSQRMQRGILCWFPPLPDLGPQEEDHVIYRNGLHKYSHEHEMG